MKEVERFGCKIGFMDDVCVYVMFPKRAEYFCVLVFEDSVVEFHNA